MFGVPSAEEVIFPVFPVEELCLRSYSCASAIVGCPTRLSANILLLCFAGSTGPTVLQVKKAHDQGPTSMSSGRKDFCRFEGCDQASLSEKGRNMVDGKARLRVT